MEARSDSHPKIRSLRPYYYAVLALWTTLILSLFMVRVHEIRSATRDEALNVATESLNKDLALYMWFASHEGGSVLKGDQTPPDPLVAQEPDREASTPSGSAPGLPTHVHNMLQIQKEFSHLYQTRSHLISLKSPHSDPAPDTWEKVAVDALALGAKKFQDFTEINGEPYLRLMKPIATPGSCLRCHGSQGYQEGDVLGAISVALPLRSLFEEEHRQVIVDTLSGLTTYLFGLAIIVFGARRLEKREQERDQTAAALQKANEELESRVAQRTGELTALNEDLRLEVEERARAEAALRKSEKRYRRLVDNAPLGIVSFRNDGTMTEVNPSFLTMFSLASPQDAKTLNLLEWAARTAPLLHDDLERFMQFPEARYAESRITAESGKVMDVRVHLTPLKDGEGHLVGVQAICDDMTERKRARAMLRASERRFRSLFESASELIHILDHDGAILQTNPAAVRALGYPADELVGRKLTELVVPSKREAFLEHFHSLAAEGYERQEMELVCRDGHVIVVDTYCSALQDERGHVSAFVLFQRDITDHKKADEKIRQQNEFLTAVLESLTHPFYVIDAATHRVLLANSAAGAGSVLGQITCYALTHGRDEPCSLAEHRCPLAEVKETGRSVTVQHVHFDAAGEQRNIEVNAYPVLDGAGNVAQVIEYAMDVTERTRAEIALKESEERMRRVIESSPIGIGIAQDSRYVYVNPAFVRTFGYKDPREIVGHALSMLCLPKDRGVLRRGMSQILEGESVSRFYEISGVKKSGSHFEAAIWLAGFEHYGEPAILVFVTDISGEKRLRAQLLHAQKMDAIGTLAGGIAHDFNNLLQAIRGYAELALFRARKDQVAHPEFQVIIKAATRAAELTQGLLTLSRQVPGEMKSVELNSEIQEVTRLLERTLPKAIKTERRLAGDLHRIEADPTQIHQVIMNLAVNARDAMPEGGKLTIATRNVFLDTQYCKTHPGTAPGEYVLLEVSDDGSGMKRETLERIFEPFFSTKGRGKGTGLGLSIVYGIVKSHGGIITCYSELGEGTIFRVYLPATMGLPEVSEPLQAEDPPGGTEGILVVDDEEPLRLLAQQILTQLGYKVFTACNGREGIEMYERHLKDISLVVLDLIMPELGGQGCLKEILRINPAAKAIIASGYAANGPIEQALKEGARGFVRKPYDTREFLELVRRVLDENL